MPTNVQIDKIALAGHAAATESSSFLESPTLLDSSELLQI